MSSATLPKGGNNVVALAAGAKAGARVSLGGGVVAAGSKQLGAMSAVVKKQLELANELGIGNALPAEVVKKLQEKPKDGITLKFNISKVWTKGGAVSAKNTSLLGRVIIPSDETFAKYPEMRYFSEENGDFGVEVDVFTGQAQKDRAVANNGNRLKIRPDYTAAIRKELVASFARYSVADETSINLVVDECLKIRFGELRKTADGDEKSLSYDYKAARDAFRRFVHESLWFRKGVETAEPGAIEEVIRRRFEIGKGMTRDQVATDPDLQFFRMGIAEGDAEPKKEAMETVEATFEESLKATIDATIGADITFPERQVQRYYANKDQWLKLPKDNCADLDKALKIQNGIIKIVGMRLVYYVPPQKDGVLFRFDVPSGVPGVFMNANAVQVDSTPPATVVRALSEISALQPTEDNPHVNHFVPDLWSLESQDGTTDSSKDAKKSSSKTYLIKVTSKPEKNRTAFPSGMITRFALSPEPKNLVSGMKEDCSVFSGTIAIWQWRDPTPDHSVPMLDRDRSEGWQSAIHLQVYSSRAEDKSLSLFSGAPMHAPSAFKTLGPTLFEGIEFFLEYSPDVVKSMMSPDNISGSEVFHKVNTAERLKKMAFSMKVFPRRFLCDWPAQIMRTCVPVSLNGARALLEVAVKNGQYAGCADPNNIAIALNEIPSDMRYKYFVPGGKTRYQFEVLLPIKLDDKMRRIFQALRDAAAEGWTGPLAEVLLDENYSAEDAESFGAHPLIISEEMSRIEVKQEEKNSKMYIFAIDADAYDVASSKESVEECMHEMFKFVPPAESPVQAAIEAPAAAAAAAAAASPSRKRKEPEAEDAKQMLATLTEDEKNMD